MQRALSGDGVFCFCAGCGPENKNARVCGRFAWILAERRAAQCSPESQASYGSPFEKLTLPTRLPTTGTALKSVAFLPGKVSVGVYWCAAAVESGDGSGFPAFAASQASISSSSQRFWLPPISKGFGDVEKAAKVFARNEVKPLQDRLLAINEWVGEAVVRFAPYTLGGAEPA